MTIFKQLLAYLRTSYRYMYILGVFILVGIGIFWAKNVFLNPQKAFWGAVSNNLSIQGYTAEINQTQGKQVLHQLAQVDTSGEDKSRYSTRISQLTDNGEMSVSTETLGTHDANYTRYASIRGVQNDQTKQNIDFSQVIDRWAKADNDAENGLKGGGSRLTLQAMIGPSLGSYPIPFANLSANDRQDILKQMKQDNLFKVDESKTKKETRNGRPVYTYEVEILPVAYVGTVKQISKMMGIKEFDDLDPNDYSGFSPLKSTVTIDVLSRQVIETSNESGLKQVYTGFGLPITVQLPAQTITETELQQKITALQAGR